MIKLALLCTDAREAYREYHQADPYFGTAPEALMQRLATLPIVGAYSGVATTLVRDTVEGFIAPPCDPPRSAEAMIRAATDRELNQRPGEPACHKGAIGNTWQEYDDRLLTRYQERLAAKRKRT